MKVKNVIISKQPENSENFKKFMEIVNSKNINVIIADIGKVIEIEKELKLYILWPDSKKFISENKLNNNSIVCKLCYKNFSCLFTGDIEEIAENQILEQYKNNLNILNATVLKVGHHGSKTSSTENFLQAVNAKISLIGVGKNNKFGHPNDDVISRLYSIGAKVYRTDEDGEIVVEVTQNGKYNIYKFIEN